VLQAAAAAAAPKESAQERLKRLMQAQLNKAAQKDSLANAQKKIQVCTDCEAAPAVQQAIFTIPAGWPGWQGVWSRGSSRACRYSRQAAGIADQEV
jgi:hypothetical protein